MRVGIIHTQQGGFSLLEVLITLVVLGAGLISLAKFQGTVLQDNDIAKARSVAVQLAEQKIEELRSFRVLTDAEGARSYQSIATNAAGESIEHPNVTYARAWTVASFCFPARNAAAAPADANCRRPTIPDFKNVTVRVAWLDTDGVQQNVSLVTSIAALDPANSGRILQTDARRPVNSCNELFAPPHTPPIPCE